MAQSQATFIDVRVGIFGFEPDSGNVGAKDNAHITGHHSQHISPQRKTNQSSAVDHPTALDPFGPGRVSKNGFTCDSGEGPWDYKVICVVDPFSLIYGLTMGVSR